MKVFVENMAGSNIKHLFDEKKLTLEKVMEVARPYPFPFGFLLNTTAPDGDNLDVFILSENELTTGQIIDCEPIGLMEQFVTPSQYHLCLFHEQKGGRHNPQLHNSKSCKFVQPTKY